VIGGLIFATIATLVFVPVVFSMVHKKYDPKAHEKAHDTTQAKTHAKAVNLRTAGSADVQHAH
jgi:hypothetical protein